jgi:peptidoglycan/LPS O-acetylase OafA/YrhL
MSHTYRADIDGLRAISVALVILFHLDAPGFGGGFVGVDVFFVISGFLITGLIFDGVERGGFSVVRFYERRARRILPMLITVVAASAVAGWFLLSPGDYEAFGGSAIAAVLAWSNFYFLHNTGYFDIPAQSMPLLHTWSLGVEEQFYLVWPAALIIASKVVGRRRIAWISVLSLIIAASFARALVTTIGDPKSGFYLPFTRAWELALGALLVFLPRPPRILAESIPVVGLGTIALSVATLSAAAPFPRFNALLPTIGAALILYPQGTAMQAALAVWPLRSLGLISYSLYLWHWPLIVFWRLYNNGLPTSPLETCPALVATALVLSVLSWHFIEQPARRAKFPPLAVFSSAAAAAIVVVVAASSIVHTGGFPQRLPPEIAAIDSKEKMWTWSCPQSVELGILGNSSMDMPPSCAYGADWKTARHRAIIWGDSLAEHLAPVLDLAGRRTGTAIALAYGCAAITQKGAPRNVSADLIPHYEDWCDAARDRVLTLITRPNDIDTVLLSTSWSFQWPLLDPRSEVDARRILRDGLDDVLARIIRAGKRPIVIADAPADYGPDPGSCVMALRSGLLRRRCPADPAYIDLSALRSQVATHAMLKEVVAHHSGAEIIDPMDFLCDQVSCRAILAGELIYRDAVHLRRNLDARTMAIIEEGLQIDKVLTNGPVKD